MLTKNNFNFIRRKWKISKKILSLLQTWILLVGTFQIFVNSCTTWFDVKKKTCKLKIFSDVLQTFLEKTDRNDHDKKRFFISHCQIFRPAFCSMYKLYVDKEYTLDFMGLIKQRTDGNSSWGWEINRGS